MAVTPVVLVLVATLAGGPLDPRYQALGGPFDLRGLGGVLLVANQLALAVTILAMVAAAASLVARFRHARGVERQQLRWVALAAALPALAMLGVASWSGLAIGGRPPGCSLAVGGCLVFLPVATGAAILRYRLYDLDRIVSRTLAYGLLTVLLGLRLRRGRPGPGPAPGPRLQPGRGRRHPGRGGAVPAGPPPRPGGRRPALQPPPPRRRPGHRGVRRPASATRSTWTP